MSLMPAGTAPSVSLPLHAALDVCRRAGVAPATEERPGRRLVLSVVSRSHVAIGTMGIICSV